MILCMYIYIYTWTKKERMEKGNFLLRVECQLINIDEIIELEKLLMDTINVG